MFPVRKLASFDFARLRLATLRTNGISVHSRSSWADGNEPVRDFGLEG